MLPMGQAHPASLQGASPGLACERLRGDELVILDAMLREHDRLELALPGEQPQITLVPPELGEITPKPVLQTVRIDVGKA